MRPNPYIGPRSFRTGETLYGRDRELRRLLDLLIAERIVLLHAPSGAGKTSLVQAALVPALRAEGFAVLPPMRVSAEAPLHGTGEDALLRRLLGLDNTSGSALAPSFLSPAPSANRYILSALLSLEEELPAEQQFPVELLSGMTLADYLELREGDLEPSDGVVLLFEQFEEILSVDPTDTAAKEAFFAQVGDALVPRHRWALFSMRDDYVGSLEPYLRPIPTQLSSTFHLDLLDVKAAVQAMQGPVRAAGAEFSEGAALQLCDDLRRVRLLHADGSTSEQLGPYVEPVQLQVVCFRLWERLPDDDCSIDREDVARLGDVDSALTGYYAERVRGIAATTGVAERAIRDWCEHALISEQGIRGQVIEGAAGLDGRAIHGLVDAHLVRGEKRRGATWFELAHDRLIAPVKADNAAWREANLGPLQRQAALWERQARPDGLLFRDDALDEAEAWAAANPELLTASERDYLMACREARAAAERERRNTRRIRALGIASAVTGVVAVAIAGLAIWQYRQAERQAGEAFIDRLTAQANEYREVLPQRSMLLAIEALRRTEEPGLPDDAARAALVRTMARSSGRPLGLRAGSGNPNFSPNERYFAQVDESRRAVVWDALSDAGEPIASLQLAEDTQFVPGPDGRHGVSFNNASSVVSIWSADTPSRPVGQIDHGGPVTLATFTNDGAMVISTHREVGRLKFWPAEGPYDKPRYEVELGPGYENWRLREDGKALYAVSTDPTASPFTKVQVWELADGRARRLRSFEIPAGYNSEFSASNYFLVATYEGTFDLYDLESAAAEPIWTTATENLLTVAFSPARREMALLQRGGSIRRVSVADRTELPPLGATGLQPQELYPTVLKYTPDGGYLVARDGSGTIFRWDLASPELAPLELRGEDSALSELMFPADSAYLLSYRYDGSVRRWNLAAPEQLLATQLTRPGDDTAYQFELDAQGRLLFNTADWKVQLWETSTPAPRLQRTIEGLMAVLSPSRRYLFTYGTEAGTLIRHDLEAPDAPPLVIRGGWNSAQMSVTAASDDGRFVVLQQWGNPQGISIWDTKDAAGAHRFYEGSWHKTDRQLVVYTPDERLLRFDLDDLGAEPSALPGVAENDPTFSVDGRYAMAVAGPSYRLWDLAAETVREAVLPVSTDLLLGFAVNEGGAFIVTLHGASDEQEQLQLWRLNARGGRPEPVIGHEGQGIRLAVSPAGDMLATADIGGTVYLWNMDGWEQDGPRSEPTVLPGSSQLEAMQFTPDGRGLVTRDFTNTIRFWRVDPTLLLQNACSFVGRNLSWDEWQRFMQPAGASSAYRRTCEALPLHGSFLSTVAGLAADDRRAEALEQIAAINRMEPGRIADPERFYERARAAALIERSRFQMQVGALDAALADLAEARRLDPATTLESWEFLELCTLGVMEQRPAEVADACDRAVGMQPGQLLPFQVRALARALQGDTAGAVADLEVYLELAAERPGIEAELAQLREWLEALRAGQDVTAEMLAALAELRP